MGEAVNKVAVAVGVAGLVVGLMVGALWRSGPPEIVEVERVVEVGRVPEACLTAIGEARGTFGTIGEVFEVVALILEVMPVAMVELAVLGDVSEGTVAVFEWSVGALLELEGEVDADGFVFAAAECEGYR